MIIEQLIIYPVKGLAGINVQEANALEKGLENDRRFMLVDKEGNFLSQRNTKEMALFKTSIEGDQLIISYKDASISLDILQEKGEPMDTIVWGNDINAIKVSTEASRWFSDQLGIDCILVKMNKESSRIKQLKKAPESTQVSFADGYPYLILGTASLDQLNGKLESSVNADRFRANIIVKTEVAHEEDDLDLCSINGFKFRVIKPCARCQVITIDQQEATSSKEPLKTLATYRQKGNKVYFGANMVCMEQGVVVKVGDKLEKL